MGMSSFHHDAFGNRTDQMSASAAFASGQGGANSWRVAQP